jgi:hypothetical protein
LIKDCCFSCACTVALFPRLETFSVFKYTLNILYGLSLPSSWIFLSFQFPFFFFFLRLTMFSQADLEFAILLCLSPTCWDYRHMPPYPTSLWISVMCILGLLMVFHNSQRLSSFFFFFLPWLDNFKWSIFKFISYFLMLKLSISFFKSLHNCFTCRICLVFKLFLFLCHTSLFVHVFFSPNFIKFFNLWSLWFIELP